MNHGSQSGIFAQSKKVSSVTIYQKRGGGMKGVNNTIALLDNDRTSIR